MKPDNQPQDNGSKISTNFERTGPIKPSAGSSRMLNLRTENDDFQIDHPKMRKTDRVLELQPKDGEKVKNSAGLVDTRLWTGGNALHAIQEPDTNLWYCKYEAGMLPDPLKQKFTSFAALKKFVERYFNRRNLNIVKVQD